MQLPRWELEADRAVAFDRQALRSFKAIIAKCIEKRINLFVFVSPYYSREKKTYRALDLAASLCRESGIPYFNMWDENTITSHPEYFSSVIHLNLSGAQAFTRIVIDKIRGRLESDGVRLGE